MLAATGWNFIASPMGITAECGTLRKVMLLWRILPGTGMPSSALNRLAVRNGSSECFLRQKVLPPAKCPQLR